LTVNLYDQENSQEENKVQNWIIYLSNLILIVRNMLKNLEANYVYILLLDNVTYD